jgi:hypothetical protein
LKTQEFIKYEIPKAVKSSELQGNNQKKILVVLNVDLMPLLSQQDHLLSKILKAVKIDFPSDIHLLSLLDGANRTISPMINNGEIEFILLFGVLPQQISFQITAPKYYPIKIQNVSLLVSDELAAIEKEQTLKKQLWTALQHLFPKEA